MDRKTVEKLIEVLQYFAQMTTAPHWVSEFIGDIEIELIKKGGES
jgi:hypothetical protein